MFDFNVISHGIHFWPEILISVINWKNTQIHASAMFCRSCCMLSRGTDPPEERAPEPPELPRPELPEGRSRAGKYRPSEPNGGRGRGAGLRGGNFHENCWCFKPIFCEHFEIAAVQKDANLVELEKCCRTHIFLQNFVLIQPRTSPPKICKNLQNLPILPPLPLTPASIAGTLSRTCDRRANLVGEQGLREIRNRQRKDSVPLVDWIIL